MGPGAEVAHVSMRQGIGCNIAEGVDGGVEGGRRGSKRNTERDGD